MGAVHSAVGIDSFAGGSQEPAGMSLTERVVTNAFWLDGGDDVPFDVLESRYQHFADVVAEHERALEDGFPSFDRETTIAYRALASALYGIDAFPLRVTVSDELRVHASLQHGLSLEGPSLHHTSKTHDVSQELRERIEHFGYIFRLDMDDGGAVVYGDIPLYTASYEITLGVLYMGLACLGQEPQTLFDEPPFRNHFLMSVGYVLSTNALLYHAGVANLPRWGAADSLLRSYMNKVERTHVQEVVLPFFQAMTVLGQDLHEMVLADTPPRDALMLYTSRLPSMILAEITGEP